MVPVRFEMLCNIKDMAGQSFSLNHTHRLKEWSLECLGGDSCADVCVRYLYPVKEYFVLAELG